MACNNCETFFQGSQTVVVSIVKLGTTMELFVQNQGRNIVQLRRILLCSFAPGRGASVLFLRPPPETFSWLNNSAFLEPSTTALFFRLHNIPAGIVMQAQAEYIEIEARSRSCPTTM